jgi:signal transduction histidine kinase
VSVAARLSSGNGERFAIIKVRDQGIGMTPEQLARVFERFYRADTSGNIPGTGLGLSMVKEVAGLHKGRIEITSEYGKGTMASLWIPLAK